MSRKKGKAQRRVKDWLGRFEAGGKAEDSARAPQRFSVRGVKLPPWRLLAPQENLEGLANAEGMVIGMFPGGAIVRSGGADLLCGIAKTFRAPEGATSLAVGDAVTVAVTRGQRLQAAGDDKVRADGMILARHPRRTALSRPQPRSGKHRGEYEPDLAEKVIAANMDLLLIVTSTRQPVYRQNLVDRFMIVAERGELKPVLAINKIDLAPADEQVVADCRAMGLEVFPCSAQTGGGLAELGACLSDKAAVLAGASGAGKSTLINALVPGASAATGEVRMRDQRGRHTTTAAAVYDLPRGGILVDTPGVRELGVRMAAADLPWYYPEFEEFAPRCRFNDCSHTHEPNCAVIAAVEAGKVPPRRYESYLRVLETLEKR